MRWEPQESKCVWDHCPVQPFLSFWDYPVLAKSWSLVTSCDPLPDQIILNTLLKGGHIHFLALVIKTKFTHFSKEACEPQLTQIDSLRQSHILLVLLQTIKCVCTLSDKIQSWHCSSISPCQIKMRFIYSSVYYNRMQNITLDISYTNALNKCFQVIQLYDDETMHHLFYWGNQANMTRQIYGPTKSKTNNSPSIHLCHIKWHIFANRKHYIHDLGMQSCSKPISGMSVKSHVNGRWMITLKRSRSLQKNCALKTIPLLYLNLICGCFEHLLFCQIEINVNVLHTFFLLFIT